MMSKTYKEKTYTSYRKLVNIPANELREFAAFIKKHRRWMDTRPIEKNLRLLSKPQTQWNANDYSVANHTIKFITNMKKVKNTPAVDGCPSRRDICLMIWGHDPQGRK